MGNIPKTIHYCWFGRNPLPELALKCIASWRKYFPDYEIIEWNEDNYDVHKIQYISEAYEAKKYAFVSDYARFDILYQFGGLYFDTDVEVIKSFDDILTQGAFMGCERNGSEEHKIQVAAGLGLAVESGNLVYKELLELYSGLSFKNYDGSNNLTTIVEYTMEVLERHGLKNIGEIQQVCNITIYPQEYFAPKDVDTKDLKITRNTHSIHHYDSSWAEWYDKAAGERGPILKKVFGKKIGQKVNEVIYIFQKYGFTGVIRQIMGQIRK